MDKLIKILKEISIVFAYDHFAEGKNVSPPYICYLLPKSNNFSADGVVYFKKNNVQIELYVKKKDTKIEKQVEVILDKYNYFYNKSEVWISSEKLYKVLYEFEMEVSEDE